MKKQLRVAEVKAQRAEEMARRAYDEAQQAKLKFETCDIEFEKQHKELQVLKAAAAGGDELRQKVAVLEREARELDLPTLQRVAAQEKLNEHTRNQIKSIMAEPALKTFYTVRVSFR